MRSASRAFEGRIKNNGTQSKRKLTPKALQQIATAALTFDDSPPVLTLPLCLPLPPSLSVPLSHSLSLTLFFVLQTYTHTFSLFRSILSHFYTKPSRTNTRTNIINIFQFLSQVNTHIRIHYSHYFHLPFLSLSQLLLDNYSIFLLLSFYILRQSKIFFL